MGEVFTLEESDTGDEDVWVPIPDGELLEAEVIGIQKVEKPFKDKTTGEPVFRMEWQFKVTEDGPYFGRKIKGDTSTAFKRHPECRFFMWAQEIIGQELPAGIDFDTDSVINSPCRILVSARELPSKKEPGKTWWLNEVKDVQKSDAQISSLPLGSASNGGYDDDPF